MNLAYDAMMFAMEAHRDQKRRYTNEPYFLHLAEVAGIAMSVGWQHVDIHPDHFMAVCWLHDVVEDCGVSLEVLDNRFGSKVTYGVYDLTDREEGNRAQRKLLGRNRLSVSPGWVQSIKVADLISNTSSIVQHDPKFAVTYLEEKRLMLDVLTKADKRLVEVARAQLEAAGK